MRGRRDACRQGLAQRFAVLADALDAQGQLESVLAGARPDHLWLALAVLSGQLPRQDDVLQAVRVTRLQGPREALRPAIRLGVGLPLLGGPPLPPVQVVTGAVTIDVHHTSQTPLATGIQRVVRETVRRWVPRHHPVLLGWTSHYRAMRPLTDEEMVRASGQNESPPGRGAAPAEAIVVPWRGTHLVPELAAEPERTGRLLALGRFSGNAVGVIGYDCVPLTSAETTGAGMGAAFANNLAALRHVSRIATISEGAAVEYRGWRSMLAGTGLPGPDIQAVSLPVEAVPASPDQLRKGRSRFLVGDLPMVLCVGSHEPRKNHLAVLQAAELCWRRGVRFSLTFVGGNAWNSERFQERLAELQSAGRPVQSVSALSEDLLWAAYRLARCVLFPSLNEGFGLPAAEALASGTPVITSDFGSMAEIASGGGAVMVDPRDDHAIACALQDVVTNDVLHAQLAEAAASRPRRSWDDYAGEVWAYLVENHRTPVAPAPEAPSGQA